MVSLLLAVIYLAFISLGLPDALLGSAWPVMQGALNAPPFLCRSGLHGYFRRNDSLQPAVRPHDPKAGRGTGDGPERFD